MRGMVAVADQGSIPSCCSIKKTSPPVTLKNTSRKIDCSLFGVLFILPSPVPQPALQEVGAGCIDQELYWIWAGLAFVGGILYCASRKQEGPSIKMLDSSYYVLRISWPLVGLWSLKFASEEQDGVGMLCCHRREPEPPFLFQTRH